MTDPRPALRDLDRTVVAVTGATAGIGRATARLLVQSGARVALLGRRRSRLDELTAELGADRVVTVCGDVADPEVSRRLVAAAVERFGGLDSLVANAGIGAYGGILDMSDEQVQTMSDTNFLGTVWGIRGRGAGDAGGGGW